MTTPDCDDYLEEDDFHATIKPGITYHGKIINEYPMTEHGPNHHCLIVGLRDGVMKQVEDESVEILYAIRTIVSDNYFACHLGSNVKVVLGDFASDDTWARLITSIELDED